LLSSFFCIRQHAKQQSIDDSLTYYHPPLQAIENEQKHYCCSQHQKSTSSQQTQLRKEESIHLVSALSFSTKFIKELGDLFIGYDEMIRIAFSLLYEEGYRSINKTAFENYLKQTSQVTLLEMNETENHYLRGFHFHPISNYCDKMNSLTILNNQQVFSKEKFVFSCIDYLFEFHYDELYQKKTIK
jgi:hypothetical protein